MAGGESNLGPGSGRRIRALTVARCRYAEDQLAAAIGSAAPRRGSTSSVGAGLDTYAYRNPNSGVRIFEVDYPATQAWKRNGGVWMPLESPCRALADLRAHLISKNSYARLRAPTFRISTRRNQLLFLARRFRLPERRSRNGGRRVHGGSMPAGSGVVFDYAVGSINARSGRGQLARMDGLTSRVALADQPVRLSIDPGALAQMLGCAGLPRRSKT